MATYCRCTASAEPGVEDISDIVVVELLNGGIPFSIVSRSTDWASTGDASFYVDDTPQGWDLANYRVKFSTALGQYNKLPCAFRIKTFPTNPTKYAAPLIVCSSGGLITGVFAVGQDKKFRIFDPALALKATSTGTLDADTGYWMVWEDNWDTSRDVTVRVYDLGGNLIENITGTGLSKIIGSPAGFGTGAPFSAWRQSGAQWYVDDFSIFNHSSWPTVPVRPKNKYLKPDANGSDNTWTGYVGGASKWESVDDTPPNDGDTTYVYDTAGMQVRYQGFGHEACGLSGAETIQAVELAVYAKRNGGSHAYLKLGMKLGGTRVSEGAWWNLSPTYGHRRYFRATDPDGNDWSAANLNLSESDIYHYVSDGDPRLTQVGLVVCYDGGVEAPPAGRAWGYIF